MIGYDGIKRSSSWCSFFTKVVITASTVAVAGTLYAANEYAKNHQL